MRQAQRVLRRNPFAARGTPGQGRVHESIDTAANKKQAGRLARQGNLADALLRGGQFQQRLRNDPAGSPVEHLAFDHRPRHGHVGVGGDEAKYERIAPGSGGRRRKAIWTGCRGARGSKRARRGNRSNCLRRGMAREQATGSHGHEYQSQRTRRQSRRQFELCKVPDAECLSRQLRQHR